MPLNKVIFGPPGTGKTRTLVSEMGEHVKSQTNARVLYCSHTKAAAAEALSRWKIGNAQNVDIQTLHSFCFKNLRLSQSQTVDTPKLADFGREFGIDIVEEEAVGRQYLDVMSKAAATMQPPMAAYESSWKPGTPKHFEAFVASYHDWKKQFGFIDFNDMLLMGLNQMHQVPSYTKIIVDEAQDLTPLQWAVMKHIIAMLPRSAVTIAGDDDQALFEWSGANPHGMREFAQILGAEQVVLEQSYRVPKRVFDLAQRIISLVNNRVEKKYQPRAAEGTVEMYPDLESLRLIGNSRSALVLHSDKFVRREIEPILRDLLVVYTNINGTRAPLDQKAGRALQVAARHSVDDIMEQDDLRSTVRGGLNQYGAGVWDNVGAHVIIERLRRRDLAVLSPYRGTEEYLQSVDLTFDPKVRVSTFHGSKGLEADDVYMSLSLSSAAWQHAEHNPDHLHRLIYTAVTRAKERLFLFDGENAYEMP